MYRKYSLIIAFALAIVLCGSVMAKPSLEELAKYVYPQNRVTAPGAVTYMSDGKSYWALADGGMRIVEYDTRTGDELKTVLDVSKTRDNQVKSIENFIVSPNASQIMIYEESQPVYRRSFTAKYYVYEVMHNVLTPLSTNHEVQRAPIFSPDSRMVAFVANNNIYIKKLDYGTEVAVTTDGEVNKVINGVPDWVYEEEFATSVSMAWAPDNLTLCYIKYDENDVPMYSFPLYGGACDPLSQYALYPGEYSYKYPVAGEKNSKVSVHSYDVENRKTKNITFSDSRVEYIPRIEYAGTPERLMVTTLNRAQNRIEMYAVNPKSTVAKSVYVDESKAWIDPITWEQVKYYPNFFVIASERSGYNQFYQYSYAGVEMKQLTSGDCEATEYYGYESKTGCHYYQSTSNGAIDRVVKRLDAKGRVTIISPDKGFSSASFSLDMNYFILNYSNVTTPNKYTLYTSAGKEVRLLVDNDDFASSYGKLPQKEFFTMQSDGYTLNGSILKPLDFNASKRYPVIMSQYSGPGSQEVLNRWKIDWDYYYVSQGYIVISVDGRGTGGRGAAFKNAVYRQLGHYETIDQIAAAQYASTLPYVDANRIGIYGWSYGGYETLMAVTHKGNPYSAAVAIAPVTNWRYYDSIYSERFMLTPRENETGYEDSAPINYVENLECPLLIMHGTADDNVHLSNVMEYVSQMQAHGKFCDMFLFPNMNHSIYGCNARPLVYMKMLLYFNQHLK